MRIPNIPRRDWQDGIGDLQDQLTEALKLPGAPADLRLLPIQAAILYDLYVNSKAHPGRGCLGAARVGSGKTLTGALAGSVINASSVLYLTPGGVKASTLNEIERYRPHWRLPPNLAVRSYSWLSRAENAEYLLRSRPQLVVFDESHHLKNRLGSSIAKRVWRLRKEDPTCVFLPLTGSIMRDSITDFSHVLTWTLGEGAPVPLDETDVKTWATVLDGPGRTKSPGPPDRDLNLGPALAEFSTQIGVSCRAVDDARAAFSDRLLATPGVVVSGDHFTDVPLTVYGTELTPPEGPVAEAMERLKTYEEAPDGYPMAAGLGAQVKSMEEQICLGFHYYLDPWPPEDWRNARSAWCKFVRDCTQDEWADEDTELQVKRAVLGGALPQGKGLLAEWLRLEPTYDVEAHRQVGWLSDHALKAAEDWGRANGRGIVWTPYKAFGRALAQRTGWAYFDQGGRDVRRRLISNRDVVKDDVVIASVKSCGTGLNLQFQWSKNLWVVPMNSSLDAEQVAARTHRLGQTQPVTVEYWYGCKANLKSFRKSVHLAEKTQALLAQTPKLNHCDLSPPEVPSNPDHPAWK